MARHRNVRNVNYDEEYHEVYDEYSRSLDEELCISPNTARQYLYGNNELNLAEAPNETDEVFEENSQPTEPACDESGDDEMNKSKLFSCMIAIQDVVGETIPEEDIVSAIKRTDFNYERALDLLLNRTNKLGVEPVTIVESDRHFSNLYIAFTAKFDFRKRSNNDFNHYNFRSYIKNFYTNLLQTTKIREITTSASNSRRSSPKPPEKRITPPSEPKQLKPVASDPKIESPVSTLKNVKNIKQKTPNEIKILYKKQVENSKLHLNLVIVGHVDAGKSTIMGHLLALRGMISNKTMHKNQNESKKAGKASFLYAWVLDETEEERNRGITIDVGQYLFETDNRVVTILDAPGHRDFIPNMIAGATKADVALLVIDATNGEFETGFEAGGQTQEHILLLRSFGINQVAVVVNKLDNVKFSQERYLEIVDKIKKFLKQVGFKDNNTHYIPCSGLTGDNLVELSNRDEFKWYKGSTLNQIIDSFSPTERLIGEPFRMTVADIFKGQTSGICLSGKLDTGYVELGQKLLIKPSNEICSVKNILFENETKKEAFAGDVVVLNVLLDESVEVSIGNVLCDLLAPCTVATKFEARIVIFHNVNFPIIKGFSAIIYSVCLNESVVLSKMCSLVDKTNQVVKRNPRLLTKNSNAIVEFTASRPICVETFNDFKDYGRFIFRHGDSTIGAGIVTKIIS